MRRPLYRCLLAAALAIGAAQATAADPILDTARNYARTQAQGLPGTVTVEVGSLDPNTRLPPCNTMQGFTPPGARPWGKTHVGVRCLGPNTWNILVPVQITVDADYVVTARPLAAGQIVQTSDLAVVRGDLSSLPNGIVTAPQAAVGKTLKNSLAAGQPLRNDLLMAPLLVRQGQTVKLISTGRGFVASGEGKAINNAAEGQIAQVRVPSGQVVSGVVQGDGSVEVGK